MLEMHLKLLQKEQLEESEVTGDLIGNKIPDKIRRVSKTSPQNNSKINKEEILRKKYISPEVKKKLDDLRLKEDWCNNNVLL